VSLLPILILIGITLAIGVLARGRWRLWSLLITSLIAIYWLQPGLPVRHMDFWLPTTSIALVVIVWVVTALKENLAIRTNLITGLVIALVISVLGLTRYLGEFCCLTPTRPPDILQILIVVAAIFLLSILILRFSNTRNIWLYAIFFLILSILIILKLEPLTKLASAGLRLISGQSVQLATGVDIRWIGFSYLAFRLLHTLIDRLGGRLPSLTLQEFMIYAIFYPSLSAGPIDRIQRFIKDLHQVYQPTLQSILLGSKRILIGIFSKFVLADGLALIALNPANAEQVHSTGWLWLMLYAFAFRIFFDFSGYTDIAIGMGNLVGIHLPENFEKPYRKQNLTLFWNSWHMTLAAWFRSYFFNPLTRKLRSSPRNIPMPLIIFIGQLTTFTLIGLWHGITWNFAIWGVWHGIGLFIHNRWSEFSRSRSFNIDNKPRLKQWFGYSSAFLTFNYVSLGWVWFALSTPAQSWNVFQKLFGLTG